jgi:hypothetical protein
MDDPDPINSPNRPALQAFAVRSLMPLHVISTFGTTFGAPLPKWMPHLIDNVIGGEFRSRCPAAITHPTPTQVGSKSRPAPPRQTTCRKFGVSS